MRSFLALVVVAVLAACGSSNRLPDGTMVGTANAVQLSSITIDGKRTLPCEIQRMKTTGKGDDEGNSWYEVKLREGRTQQIRKMFQAVGHPVSKLRRVAIGPLALGDLAKGAWRALTDAEVSSLAPPGRS